MILHHGVIDLSVPKLRDLADVVSGIMAAIPCESVMIIIQQYR